MKKQINTYVAMVLAALCIAMPVVHAEPTNDLMEIVNALRGFSAENIEEMAASLPNATIPYRGSDTINCLNNTITCQFIDDKISVDEFIQVNNVFPVHWSDVFCIGMSADTLIETLNSYTDSADGWEVSIVHADDRDVELITCLAEGNDESRESFKIVFYIFDKQVFQIEFAFL